MTVVHDSRLIATVHSLILLGPALFNDAIIQDLKL